MGRRRARYPARHRRSDRCASRGRCVQTAMARRAGFPAAGSFESVLPQQGCVHRRPRRQWHPHHAGGSADSAQLQRSAVYRHCAFHGRLDDRAVLFHARLLSGRHGGARRLRRLLALDPAGQTELRALHQCGACQAGQDAFLPRLPASSEALVRRIRRRPRHQGAGDDGLHAAVVPVRIQVDQGRDSASQGHRPAAGDGQVSAGQAA